MPAGRLDEYVVNLPSKIQFPIKSAPRHVRGSDVFKSFVRYDVNNWTHNRFPANAIQALWSTFCKVSQAIFVQVIYLSEKSKIGALLKISWGVTCESNSHLWLRSITNIIWTAITYKKYIESNAARWRQHLSDIWAIGIKSSIADTYTNSCYTDEKSPS